MGYIISFEDWKRKIFFVQKSWWSPFHCGYFSRGGLQILWKKRSCQRQDRYSDHLIHVAPFMISEIIIRLKFLETSFTLEYRPAMRWHMSCEWRCKLVGLAHIWYTCKVNTIPILMHQMRILLVILHHWSLLHDLLTVMQSNWTEKQQYIMILLMELTPRVPHETETP